MEAHPLHLSPMGRGRERSERVKGRAATNRGLARGVCVAPDGRRELETCLDSGLRRSDVIIWATGANTNNIIPAEAGIQARLPHRRHDATQVCKLC